MSKAKWIAAAALVVAAASLFMFFQFFHDPLDTLIMENSQTGEIYFEAPLNEDHTFSVSYTHSVNKSMVEEYYITDSSGQLTLFKARYHHFGAGVATELSADQYLTYEDGFMVINNMNIPVNPLIYKVGRQAVSDPILHIGENSWHLAQLAPELTSVAFKIK